MPNFTVKEITLIAIGGYLLLMSLITFIVYYSDKVKAKKGKYRTKEKTLLFLSLIGGAFGGYLAMLLFRHKTTKEHWNFTFVNLFSLLIHIGVILLVIFVIKF